MWPSISQAPEDVTCVAISLGAGPLLCTHHPGKGVCTHSWGRGGGELPLQTTCFTFFPFSPLKKRITKIGNYSHCSDMHFIFTGTLPLCLTLLSHTYMHVHIFTRGDFQLICYLYVCPGEEMSYFGEERGSLIWKNVFGLFFGKERGKRQKEMQKFTS